jgi:hypothetical protein
MTGRSAMDFPVSIGLATATPAIAMALALWAIVDAPISEVDAGSGA